jgi:hypothetical protein
LDRILSALHGGSPSTEFSFVVLESLLDVPSSEIAAASLFDGAVRFLLLRFILLCFVSRRRSFGSAGRDVIANLMESFYFVKIQRASTFNAQLYIACHQELDDSTA